MIVELTLSTPEIAISDNAKVCYATTGDRDITKSLVGDKGHLAVLRFAYASFHIEDISINCHTQFVRSSHLDFLVESKRYCSADKGDFKFIMPMDLSEEAQAVMKRNWETAMINYKHLIACGVKKEDARAVLPTNTSTKMNVTGNLQGWDSFINLRLNSHAQKEIRLLAFKILTLLVEQYPQVFTDRKYDNKTYEEWRTIYE